MVPLTPAMDGLASALIDALLYGATIDALGRSLLSPGRPSWRLAPVSDAFADRLAIFPTIIGVAVGLAGFMARASIVLGASDAAADANRCLGVILQVLAVGGALALARSTSARRKPPTRPARGCPGCWPRSRPGWPWSPLWSR